jgi:hypothetical protein
MPTVHRQSGYRFFFYSHEPNEPPHLHVDKGGGSAKVWLHDVSFARTSGFRPKELTAILIIVRENREALLEAWHEYFGPEG